MLDCSARPEVFCDPKDNSTSEGETPSLSCGSDLAFPYFISFYVLCSFLVSTFHNLLFLIFFYKFHKSNKGAVI